MKRFLLVAAAVAALGVAGGGSAWADGTSGNHRTVIGQCSIDGGAAGPVTIYVTSGQSAWTSDSHWVVLSFTGTFDGATFSKQFGQKNGYSGQTETCSGDDGAFSFVTVVGSTPNG